jgi:hypothetical protein
MVPASSSSFQSRIYVTPTLYMDTVTQNSDITIRHCWTMAESYCKSGTKWSFHWDHKLNLQCGRKNVNRILQYITHFKEVISSRINLTSRLDYHAFRRYHWRQCISRRLPGKQGLSSDKQRRHLPVCYHTKNRFLLGNTRGFLLRLRKTCLRIGRTRNGRNGWRMCLPFISKDAPQSSGQAL